MLLEKTGEIAKYRLTTSDLLQTKVSDVMKQQRRVKETAFKRVRALHAMPVILRV